MKGLTWVVVFVAIGIAAGAIAAALMPARYRAVTAVHIEAARDPDVTFLYRLNARLDDLLQRSLFEDRMERLMQEVGLYKAERDSGRSADALLLLPRVRHHCHHEPSTASPRRRGKPSR